MSALIDVWRPTQFLCRNRKTYAEVNLDRLQHWIDQGRLHSTPENPITAKELLLSGCVHNVHDGIKLLGNVRAVLVADDPRRILIFSICRVQNS